MAAVVAPVVRRGQPRRVARRRPRRRPASTRRARAGLAFTVLRSCARFGGPAAAPLERAAATLRARDAVAAEQLAQSAQARLSARVLTLVPVALLALLAITDPKVRAAVATPAGLAVVDARRRAQRRRCAVDAPDHRTAAMTAPALVAGCAGAAAIVVAASRPSPARRRAVPSRDARRSPARRRPHGGRPSSSLIAVAVGAVAAVVAARTGDHRRSSRGAVGRIAVSRRRSAAGEPVARRSRRRCPTPSSCW